MELLYLGCLDDGDRYEFENRSSLSHPLDLFEEIDALSKAQEQVAADLDLRQIELYCCIGSPEDHQIILEAIANLKTNENDLLNFFIDRLDEPEQESEPLCWTVELDNLRLATQLKIPKEGDVEEYFSLANQILEGWIEQERPMLFKQQVITQSFMLDRLRGVRIKSPLFNAEEHSWSLLVEGCKQINLREDYPYLEEEAVVPVWTARQIASIVDNPINAYGVHFDPFFLFIGWNDAFVYSCSIATGTLSWDIEKLKKLYPSFLEFLKHRLPYIETKQTIVSEDLFLSALNQRIDDASKFLQGHEDSYLSKNFIAGMIHNVYQLKDLAPLFDSFHPGYFATLRQSEPYDASKCIALLDSCSRGTSYEKGLAFERVIECFLGTIEGWRLTGRRIRTLNCEIDLCYCNVSLDPVFWKMGSLLLVECKNRSHPAEIKDVRNLFYVMECKGSSTSILASRSGFTEDARREVRRLALRDSYLLLIDGNDLETISPSNTPRDILISKFENLIAEIEDDASLLGFA